MTQKDIKEAEQQVEELEREAIINKLELKEDEQEREINGLRSELTAAKNRIIEQETAIKVLCLQVARSEREATLE